ncbi:hypothetical protein SAMN05192535_3946 [Shouchella rhizosphaerae]|nr:hypothetical protein SAMN05192535_3946 [Shouchella rhizosphaerae]
MTVIYRVLMTWRVFYESCTHCYTLLLVQEDLDENCSIASVFYHRGNCSSVF